MLGHCPDPSRILTALETRWLGAGQWRVISDFHFWSRPLQCVVKVIAPYDTDFASVPRPLWALFPRDGSADPAAVGHDFGYRAGFLEPGKEQPHLQMFTKADWDLAFEDLMRSTGVSRFRRIAFYEAVHYFGGAAWQPR